MALRDDRASDRHVLYFAGRPVGVLFDGLASVHFISTDHLGTPIVASTGAGTSAWDGGFEPFGADFSSAQASGVFLRFPGQWDDGTWEGQDIYYNVHRWYAPMAGRYLKVDPLGLLEGDGHPYIYVAGNPVLLTDVSGLTSYKGFPPEKERQAKEAVDKVKNRLRDSPCCVDNGPKLLRRLEKTTLVYIPDLSSKGGPLCGFVSPSDWIRRRIQVGERAYDTARCGLLECTVIHELIHLGARNAGEEAAYKAEKDCFDCGTGKPPDK